MFRRPTRPIHPVREEVSTPNQQMSLRNDAQMWHNL